MTEHKDGFPEKYHILPNPFKAIGHFIKEACSLHLLSPVSDHKFDHPLDTPVEPVRHLPNEQEL